MKPLVGRAILAALFALSLSGCIDSSSPILADAEPVFGQRLKLQFFTLRKGFAENPEQATYVWNGSLYAHASGGMKSVSAFSVHPFEAGDYIVQTVPAKRVHGTEYAIMHKLAEGVFQVIAIDEDDADAATRTAYCRKAQNSSCQIVTREHLFAFARATAARRKDNGGLVIRLPNAPERPAKRAPAPRRR